MAGRDQRPDLPLPLAQPIQRIFSGSGLTPSPGADAKTAEREFGELFLSGRTHGSGGVAGLPELFRRPPAIASNQGSTEVQTVPNQGADQAQAASLRKDRFQAIVHEHPEVMLEVIKYLSQRLRLANEQLQLATRPPEPREAVTAR